MPTIILPTIEYESFLEFTIPGRPISKKNSKRITRRGGRTMLLPSQAFEAFHDEAVYRLKPQVKGMIVYPVFIDYRFFIKGKGIQDADNAIASINDILQDAGVLFDDKLIRSGIFEQIRGCSQWETKLVIYTLK